MRTPIRTYLIPTWKCAHQSCCSKCYSRGAPQCRRTDCQSSNLVIKNAGHCEMRASPGESPIDVGGTRCHCSSHLCGRWEAILTCFRKLKGKRYTIGPEFLGDDNRLLHTM